MLERHLHVELAVAVQRCDVQLRVDDLNIGVRQDVVRRHFAFARRIDDDLFRTVAMQFAAELLEVQNDLRDVLFHAFDGRELVQHAVDLDGRDRNARQAGQQDAAHRVAKRRAKAALQRLHHELAVLVSQFHTFEFGLFDLDQWDTLLRVFCCGQVIFEAYLE